jgi:2-oxoglutarate dehydrogenase E2 component (dihydrolipoamide succinyltransferase)
MAYEIRVPALGESIVEATVARWIKQPGDAVAIGEPVVELETDKVNLEVAADEAGVLDSITKAEGDQVEIGDLLGTITAGSNGVVTRAPEPAAAQPEAASTAAAPAPVTTPANENVAATPVAQRVADEYGVDLGTISGSGRAGA